jgi:hypothetical protein
MLTQVLRNICVSIIQISDIHFMRFGYSLRNSSCGSNFAFHLFAALLLAVTLFVPLGAAGQAAISQATASETGQPVNTAWLSLSRVEQTALAPLAKHWNGLSEGQKRKWHAIAQTYPDLAPPEQEKLHSRMVEWAALSAKDREAARLNFARTKSVTKSDRAANWEAYQALSLDERKKLADDAKGRPVGAAVAVKPVTADKLAKVPVTRHTPESERTAAAAQSPLNRNTLLPPLPASAPRAAASPLTAKP